MDGSREGGRVGGEVWRGGREGGRKDWQRWCVMAIMEWVHIIVGA